MAQTQQVLRMLPLPLRRMHTGLPGSARGLISECVMEAIEEEEPPQPSELDVELLPDTPGNQSGERDSYDLTILHFNDVYDMDPST